MRAGVLHHSVPWHRRAIGKQLHIQDHQVVFGQQSGMRSDADQRPGGPSIRVALTMSAVVFMVIVALLFCPDAICVESMDQA